MHLHKHIELPRENEEFNSICHKDTPTGKRPLGRPRRRWEDNIRMDLKKLVSIRGIVLIRLRIGIIGELL